MSLRSSGSHDGSIMPSSGDIIRSAVLKKMKTSRKKYFVLRAETPDSLARLEYYDSEKKFRHGLPPKRCIPLKTCFNINKKQDSKYKNVIALYTKDDCFCIVFDSEEDLKLWFKDFLTLQHGEEIPEGEALKPKFEYVWEVTMCKRGLGEGRTGLYRLCLTNKTITLVKIDEPIPTVIELSLTYVRSCGNLKNFFFMEVGRMSEIGAGEIWFEADDSNIALNIQTTVKHRFTLARERIRVRNSTSVNNPINGSNESADLQPMGRTRSVSATESSKTNSKKFNPIMSSKLILPQDCSSTSESTLTSPVTTSSGNSTTTVSGVAMSIYNHFLQRGTGKRRHSISGGGTTWSAGGNHQRTQSLPVATPYTPTTAPPPSTSDNNHPSPFPTTICLTNHQLSSASTASSKKMQQGATGGGKCSFRERCDSMPSRPRTSSEGTHNWGKPYLVPYNRAHHLRDASHSPPTGNLISPPSDSTGSSCSLADEHDGHNEMEHQRLCSTLTPDEVIAEEDYPESPKTNPSGSNYVLMGMPESNYLEMTPGTQYGSHNYTSNSASMSSVTSGTPSTDLRADYPLEKVYSYVSADDDDTRPTRAYSVGSKPPESQLSSTPENARVRAFSVGSKTKKYFNRVIFTHHQPTGVKSSSAPLLAPNSRMGSSHGSINNPMDDLMEMDFSSNGTSRSRTSTNASGSSDARSSCNHRNSTCNGAKGKFFGFLEQHFGVARGDNKKSTPDGYVEMKPGRTTSSSSDHSPYVDMTQGHRGLSSAYMDMGNTVPPVGHALSPYLDMSGNNVSANNNVPLVGHPQSPYLDMSGGTPLVGNGNSPYMAMTVGNNVAAATRENVDYMDMSGSSPMRTSPNPNNMTLTDYARQFDRSQDYMDMNQRHRVNSNSSANSRTAISPGAWNNDHNSDYLDMSGRNNRHSERTNSFGSHMSSSPHFESTSPKYVDSNFVGGVSSRTPQGRVTDIDGYVEMTPGEPVTPPIRHNRQSSIDSTDNDHGDYLNMSGINTALSATKGRSQPITIQASSGNNGVKNSSPISISSLLKGRKGSPTRGSSPTTSMHLPLNNPYASLPRQRSPRKSSSQTGSSKDSSVDSSVTTTPSSSITMFPMSLNSPSSPASKTTTPTTSSVKVPASVLNVPYKSSKKRGTNGDYATMDFETVNKSSPLEAQRVDDSPYVNYCPLEPTDRLPRVPSTNMDDYSDYAVMKPGVFPTKCSTLPRTKSGASSGLASPLANHLSTVGLSDRPIGFMPIREKDERMCSPKPGDVLDRLEDKTLETANMEFEEDTRPYDRLKSLSSGLVSPAAKISRPNSSNSDKIKTGSERNSRPSSVCSEGLTSRLGSNSSVYSSSSSASTVVNVPTSKPEETDPSPHQQQIVTLNYASLDLSSAKEEKSPRSTEKNSRSLKTASSDTSLSDAQVTFVYADIDFVRSEERSKGATSANNSAVVKN